MQKFETYYYDEVFYSKKEIEAMGLKLYCIKNLLKEIKNKNDFYDLIIYYSKGVQHSSLNIFFQTVEQEKVFFKDFGNHGIIIIFDKHYGVRLSNQSFLFHTEEERKEFMNNPEYRVRLKFDSFYTSTSSIHEKYNSQEQGKQKRLKLQEIIH